MKMRYPERVGLTSHFLDDFLAHSKPLVRLPEVAGEQLHNDVRASEGRLNDWRWVANASPDALMAERERLDARRNDLAAVDLHPSGNGTYESRQTYAPHEGPPTADAPDVPVDGRALAPTDWITRQRGPEFTAHVARDGTVHFDDARNLQLNGRAGIGVMGTFDVTDALMRGHGNDPYAREKMKFLERTFDERVEIGRRDRHDQLMQSAELARRNVERLFAMTPALAARKTGLFELWDDCAESGDPELVAGGIAARALVVGIIRGRLRGADAYTADELARLNAHRQSKATFAPYE